MSSSSSARPGAGCTPSSEILRAAGGLPGARSSSPSTATTTPTTSCSPGCSTAAAPLPVARGRGQGAARRPARVCVAPPGYHVLVERRPRRARRRRAACSSAGPSIDVLFESAADAYGAGAGRRACSPAPTTTAPPASRRSGAAAGSTIVQDPATAERPEMPRGRARGADARRGRRRSTEIAAAAVRPCAAGGCAVSTPRRSDQPAVLLVDDRPENLLALEAVLEPLPCRLVTATSGEEALKAAAARRVRASSCSTSRCRAGRLRDRRATSSAASARGTSRSSS